MMLNNKFAQYEVADYSIEQVRHLILRAIMPLSEYVAYLNTGRINSRDTMFNILLSKKDFKSLSEKHHIRLKQLLKSGILNKNIEREHQGRRYGAFVAIG